jgi:hypothetical protein
MRYIVFRCTKCFTVKMIQERVSASDIGESFDMECRIVHNPSNSFHASLRSTCNGHYEAIGATTLDYKWNDPGHAI